MTGIVYVDDVLIVNGSYAKLYHSDPGVVIRVRRATPLSEATPTW